MRTLLLSSLLLLACAPKPQAPVESQPKKADTVKPGTPTTLTSQVEGQVAKLSLRFDGSGDQVSVSLSGIDGVAITRAPELPNGVTVKAGEVKELPVSFTGTGHLVVTVTGNFGAGVRSRVHSVQVGEGTRKDLGTVQTTTDGDVVKVMP